MSLSRGEINPLSVLGLRKLNFIPQHFSKISVDREIDIDRLDIWINFNLNSRYAIKKQFMTDQNNKLIEVTEIGLEDPKEILILTLGCSFLHKN